MISVTPISDMAVSGAEGLIWNDVPTSQDPTWTETTPTQAPAWTEIVNTQDPDWS